METRGAVMKKSSKKRLGGGRALLALAALSAFAAPALYASTAMASCSISGTLALNTGGVLEDCTVTQGGVYDVTEYGGSGGGALENGNPYDVSLGAEISAQFSLAAGQAFELVTGAAGVSYNGTVATSGGGGTFFVLNNGGALTPYLVAGGGGGAFAKPDGNLYYTGQGGQVSGNPSLESGDGGQTTTSTGGGGGGGGGYLTDGEGGGGSSFVGTNVGSYGAGGGGTGMIYSSASWGGGGGGYDGGDGGYEPYGDGGTNYYNPNLATDVTQVAGTTTTGTPVAGQIDFTLVSGTPVPEPPAFAIFLLAASSLFPLSRLVRRPARRAA